MDLDHELVVIQNFLSYVKGEVIKDAEKIKDILESEWRAHVQKKPPTE